MALTLHAHGEQGHCHLFLTGGNATAEMRDRVLKSLHSAGINIEAPYPYYPLDNRLAANAAYQEKHSVCFEVTQDEISGIGFFTCGPRAKDLARGAVAQLKKDGFEFTAPPSVMLEKMSAEYDRHTQPGKQ